MESNFLMENVTSLNAFMDNLCDRPPLCVMHLNVQRVANLNKFHNIITLISSMTTKPDIIILTETWIIKGTESLYELPGYIALHACRESQSAGIALYYKVTLSCEPLETSIDEVSLIHAKFYSINQPTNYLLVTAVYMPDIAHFPLLNSRLNSLLTNTTRNHVLLGDFNINIRNSNNISNSYEDTIESLGYSIKNTLPTRPRSQTLIDHIIANFENVISVTLENDLSDHNGIIALFDSPIDPVPTRGYMTIERKRTDFEGVISDLSDLNLQGLDAPTAFSTFHTTLRQSVINNTHSTIIKVKKNNPYASSWVNDTLIRLSKRKHRLLSKRNNNVISSNLGQRIDEITQRVEELKALLRENDMQSKYGNDVNPKTKWKHINDLLGRRSKSNKIDMITNDVGDSLVDSKSIADTLNQHFINIHSSQPNAPEATTTLHQRTRTFPSIFITPTTSDEVLSIIHNLKRKKSVGYDYISTSLIKHCATILSDIVTYLFNSCVEEGYYPKELKMARVIPIYKKGDPSMGDNYRPISILPLLNLLFEKLLYKRLLCHLTKHNILFDRQYGFRARSNTTTCAIDFIENVYTHINNNYAVSSVFLDLSKAFDLVPHENLLRKLHDYGVRGIANALFDSYLTNRSQFVVVNGTSSDALRVCKGVPQGSALAPLLFLTYINDISRLGLCGKLFLYADDTTLLYASNTHDANRHKANADLNTLNNFFQQNGLQLNTQKTKSMHFATKRCTTDITAIAPMQLMGSDIESVKNFKYLGLHLDYNLCWETHIQLVGVRMKQVIGILYRTRNLLPLNVRKMLYFSMIQCHLRYMVELWGAASLIHLKRLQILQNVAMRNILHLPFLTPRIRLFPVELHILPVQGIYKSALAELVYKMVGNLSLSEIELPTALHNYASRSRLQLRVPHSRLSLCENRIAVAGARTFNALPQEIRDSRNLRDFKNKCFAIFHGMSPVFLTY